MRSLRWSIRVGLLLVLLWASTASAQYTYLGRPPYLTACGITAASGTGITVNQVCTVSGQPYKVTVTYQALAAGGLTADVTIGTLNAKARLTSIIADTTIIYSGGTVATATIQVGKSVGGNEYVLVHDVKSATVTKGLADGDLGTSISRANAVQGGDLPSWSGTTAISVRLTTTVGNTNALTQGSTTYYLTTQQMP